MTESIRKRQSARDPRGSRPSAEQSPGDFGETEQPIGVSSLNSTGLAVFVPGAVADLRGRGFDWEEIAPRIIGIVRKLIDNKIGELRRRELVEAVRTAGYE